MTNASWGGLGSGNFVNSAPVSGGSNAGGRTLVDTVITDAMLQAGSVLAVKYRGTSSNTPAANGVRFCVYRKNGSNFDFVGASETFTLDVTGATVTKTLGTPIAGVRVGDYCGVWLGDSSVNANQIYVTTGGSLKYLDGAMPTGTNINFSTGSIADTLNLEFFGAQPVAAMTGDSIEVGHGGTFLSFFDTDNVTTFGPAVGADGAPLCELGYNMAILAPTFTYIDVAKGSQPWSWVRSTGLPAALFGTGMHGSVACGASEIWAHCGVNDIFAGRLWSAISADLDAIYAACGSLPLFIDEVLPWASSSGGSNANAATTRTNNTNLAAWAVGKSTVRIVPCWAAFGVFWAGTGLNDKLNPIYDSGDGIHLNALGAALLATLRLAIRSSYYGGAGHPVGKIVQPTSFGAMSMRRYGSFAGRVPTSTPPYNPAKYSASAEDAVFSGVNDSVYGSAE